MSLREIDFILMANRILKFQIEERDFYRLLEEVKGLKREKDYLFFDDNKNKRLKGIEV